jgi:hypothetical protein
MFAFSSFVDNADLNGIAAPTGSVSVSYALGRYVAQPDHCMKIIA